MAIDFPSSPTEGQVYWTGGGLVPSYTYRSGAWTKYAGTAETRNRFVNPAFQINEQNGLTDGSNVQGLVMAEQYHANHVLSNGVYRGQRLALVTPGGGKHRLRISMTTAETALVAGEWLNVNCGVEASRMVDFEYGTAKAKWGVVRFGWKSPAGTFCFVIRNNGNTRSLLVPFTVAAGQANTDMLFVLSIPPCIDGTWKSDNSHWGWIYWMLMNANMGSVANSWIAGNYAGHTSQTNTFTNTVGNTAELFDVGFYRDPYATGLAPPFQVPHYEDDMEDCQRYWYKLTNARGVIATATVGYITGTHPVPMRTGPSVSINGSIRLHDLTTAPNVSGISHNYADPISFYMGPSVASGLIPGRPAQLLTDAQTANYLAVNARM